MPFVIIASPRTGSTHLTGLLDGQDDVICHGEIFHPKRAFLRLRGEEPDSGQMTELDELRRRDPRAFLSWIYERNHGCAHVGFKIFGGQNDDILGKLIGDRTVRKVVLYRRNILAVWSSSRIAHRFGERQLTVPRETQPQVSFHEAAFAGFCRRYKEFYRDVLGRLNSARMEYHVVEYELINDRSFFSGLVNFIGADAAEIMPAANSVKLNSTSILERFSNPEVVRAFLRTNGLLGWLHETAVSLDELGAFDEREIPDGSGPAMPSVAASDA